MHDVHKANMDCTSANYRTLHVYSNRTLKLAQFGSAIALVACIMFVPFTLIENYVSGKHDPLLQAFLPFVDENTTIGYAILFVYHLGMLLFAAAGIMSGDLLPVILVIHLNTMAAILANMVDQLNTALEELPAHRRDSCELRRFFRNIILLQKEFCDQLKIFANIFEMIMLFEIITDAMSLCFIQIALLKVSANCGRNEGSGKCTGR